MEYDSCEAVERLFSNYLHRLQGMYYTKPPKGSSRSAWICLGRTSADARLLWEDPLRGQACPWCSSSRPGLTQQSRERFLVDLLGCRTMSFAEQGPSRPSCPIFIAYVKSMWLSTNRYISTLRLEFGSSSGAQRGLEFFAQT